METVCLLPFSLAMILKSFSVLCFFSRIVMCLTDSAVTVLPPLNQDQPLSPSLRSHQDLHQQLVVVQLVLGGHSAGIKHYHLPAKVVITCTHTQTQTHRHTQTHTEGQLHLY